MQSIDWVAVLFRWTHIIPAITLLGGTLFLALVAVPTTTPPEGGVPAWLGKVRKRWAMLSGLCILLLVVSGLWNFMAYRMPEIKDTGPLYHALFGIKMLLSLGVFFIVSVMAGRSPTFAPMRARPGRMLLMAAALGVAIVLLAGVLHNIKPAPPSAGNLPDLPAGNGG